MKVPAIQINRLPDLARRPLSILTGLVVAALGVGACATPAQVCAGALKPMVEARLFFGDDIAGRATLMASQWQAFVDQEVTPRFPEGFTVVSTSGQWRRPDGSIAREPGHELLIDFTPGPGVDDRVQAIRQAYIARFMQQSVLLAEAPVCAGF